MLYYSEGSGGYFMLFNSYIFIFIFLPLVLAGWYFLNSRGFYQTATCFLAAMSLWFYGYFNLYYLGIILVSILGNYLLSFLLRFSRTKLSDRIFLLAGLAFNLGFLFYFKYYDFFFENINIVFHTNVAMHNILLPLGISFFTFQQVSFIVDRCQHKAEHYPFIDYVTFVTFFPQLVAGPIVLYKEMMPQFADKHLRSFNRENFAKGIALFTLGLSKKVLLADVLALPVNYGFTNTAFLDSPSTLLVILAYTFEIYFDFSGYSDMAMGLGLLFNIKLPVNFNSPYKACTVKELWQRWHITLSRFFIQYVYIPLGGSRKGKVRTLINTFLVFFLSGLWHGANWTFICWGLLYFVLLMFEKLTGFHKKNGWYMHIYTMFFVILGWVLFRADSITAAGQYIGNMFGAGATGFIDATFIDCVKNSAVIFAAAVIFSFPVVSKVGEVLEKKPMFKNVLASVCMVVVFIASILICIKATYNPFIYLNF